MQGFIRFYRGLARWFRLVFELIFAGNVTVTSDWGHVTVDSTPLLDNRRQQVVDVASGGSRRFTVAYITSRSTSTIAPVGTLPFEPAVPEDMGDLHFAHFDVDSGLKTPSETVVDLKAAGWVRAATGGPVKGRNICPFEVQLFGLNLQVPLLRNSEFITFFAYGGLTDRFEFEAGLLRVRWCSGRANMTKILVADNGIRPSVAIGRRDDETKLLFVYGKENQIFGLFLDLEGERIGVPILLATFPEEQSVRSTDVIWNTVGDHFIVGYMQHEKSPVDSVTSDLCSVRNVRVNWDGVADEPRLHGACDSRQGGHHTSVDYDDRLDVNPNGVYAWWYQGIDDGKGVRMMDASGEPTGNRVDLTQIAWTYPVTARREEKPPWPFGFVLSQLSGSYILAARESPFSGPEQRMSAWTFKADGNLHPFGLLEATPQGADPVAIEALVNESVSVWRTTTKDESGDRWGLTVFPHSTKPLVAVETER